MNNEEFDPEYSQTHPEHPLVFQTINLKMVLHTGDGKRYKINITQGKYPGEDEIIEELK